MLSLILKAIDWFLGSALARAVALVVGVLALYGVWTHEQRAIGARDERAKLERAANEQVKKADKARADACRVRSSGSGVRDPYATNY